jgi:hypothetical protein
MERVSDLRESDALEAVVSEVATWNAAVPEGACREAGIRWTAVPKEDGGATGTLEATVSEGAGK